MSDLVPTGVRVTRCPPAGVVESAAIARFRLFLAHPDHGGTVAGFETALAAWRLYRPRRLSGRWSKYYGTFRRTP